MINAGILDGDTVIIQEADTANTGEIVVALVDNKEATLKRLRRRGDSIALEAANPAYETRLYGADRVQGSGQAGRVDPAVLRVRLQYITVMAREWRVQAPRKHRPPRSCSSDPVSANPYALPPDPPAACYERVAVAFAGECSRTFRFFGSP